MAALLGAKNAGLAALKTSNNEAQFEMDAGVGTRDRGGPKEEESMKNIIKNQIDGQRDSRRGGVVKIRKKVRRSSPPSPLH